MYGPPWWRFNTNIGTLLIINSPEKLRLTTNKLVGFFLREENLKVRGETREKIEDGPEPQEDDEPVERNAEETDQEVVDQHHHSGHQGGYRELEPEAGHNLRPSYLLFVLSFLFTY